ncbi:helix-turn-helix domain-containing protein [Ferruginivarius sediminum]|uniref:XRE family transcriptional regulator n=1 Tax=Ferruginivarius sediminum TaxID=2661937 RepID=A0A369T8A8_9PROT|nr:helix-turn-helix transcriptional regulator [Ferruginivarius sediminum]RDD61559.1 XRE family transcriptional regulator [Ferruginivarius sediminum]
MTTDRKIEHVSGSTNVLADLGFEDAAEVSAKVQLALRINRIIEKRHLRQVEAAKLLGITQGNVSALKNYKLDGFSLDRLMRFLNSLDRDVEIRIKRKPRTRAEARTRVVA